MNRAKSKYEGLKVWWDGRILDYEDAKVPILTHSLQYGSGIFEGIRGFEGKNSSFIFRLNDHVDRFFRSMRIYEMAVRFTKDQVSEAIRELVRINSLGNCYIRPYSFVLDDSIGLSRVGKPISVYIGAVPFSAYFGGGRAISAKISSWRRINPNSMPVQAKSSSNYANSVLANNEARNLGFDEAILLDNEGYVAEGPGENIFLIKRGKLLTPSLENDILEGITRETVITLARDLGIGVEEREIHREELLTADEAFFCGTAAGISPIGKVDNITIGEGGEGKITGKIKERYGRASRGELPEHRDWVVEVAT